MANCPSLLYPFLNIFLILRRISKKTKSVSVLPLESPCEDGAGEIQIGDAYPLWSQLDKDILDLIIEKLDLFSRFRFSSVCKPWLLAINESRTPDPVLRLLPHDPHSEHLTFSDLHTGALHHFDLPDSIKGKWSWCITSSDGRWIVVITSHHRQLLKDKIEISLFDPISRSLVRLPKPKDFIIRSMLRASIARSRKSYLNLAFDRYLLTSKFEIFSLDGSEKIISWTYGKGYLSFCRSGGKKWYQIHDIGGYSDICFINGTLYVLSCARYGVCNELDSSIGVEISTRSMKFEGIEITVKFVPSSGLGYGLSYIPNFVKFNGGELLRVNKLCNIAEDQEEAIKYVQWYYHSEFQLAKFEHRSDDDNNMMCTQLSSGLGLGDEALLFSQCNCICIPAKKYKGVEENCIYFLNEMSGIGNIYKCNEFGMCHVDNGRIESTSLAKGHGFYCWFLPRIKKKSVPQLHP